jgi:hypothetical protein
LFKFQLAEAEETAQEFYNTIRQLKMKMEVIKFSCISLINKVYSEIYSGGFIGNEESVLIQFLSNLGTSSVTRREKRKRK